MKTKETIHGNINVCYYTGLKSLTTIKNGCLIGFRYSPRTTTKQALKHFRNYIKSY